MKILRGIAKGIIATGLHMAWSVGLLVWLALLLTVSFPFKLMLIVIIALFIIENVLEEYTEDAAKRERSSL